MKHPLEKSDPRTFVRRDRCHGKNSRSTVRHWLFTVALALSASSLSAPIAAFDLNLVSTGVGTWADFSRSEAPANDTLQVYTFTSVRADLYANVGGIKMNLLIPLLWSAQLHRDQSRIRLGNLSWYAGYPVGLLEPRVGMVIPTGYGTDGPWIGSRNVKVRAGVALNSDLYDQDRFRVSGETMANFYIGEELGGLARNGSWELVTSAKVNYRPSDTWKTGIELLAPVKYVDWIWDQKQLSVTLVPNVYAEYYFTPSVFGGLKAGFGPRFGRSDQKPLSRQGYALNVGASLHVYP